MKDFSQILGIDASLKWLYLCTTSSNNKKEMKNIAIMMSALMAFCAGALQAQEVDETAVSGVSNVPRSEKKGKLSLGGYGEVAMSRNFYSDNVYRYSRAAQYKGDPSHGRFDIPHAVISLGYDFGKGWSLGTEIEFEHGGTGGAVEQEFDEGGEWEQETEKGGEVELEQFWLQKSFSRAVNIRAGHMIVPVGLNNAYHEPLNFFTVYRPEGENTVLPSTWHETGIAVWGRIGDFRYEAQVLAGLDAYQFSRDGWINAGTQSPFEFSVANQYGFALRIDNYTLRGLRLGFSGYFGKTMHNSYPNDLTKTYDDVDGKLWVGSFDFTYKGCNWIVRGQADYGRLGSAATVSSIKSNRRSNDAPYEKTPVGKNAVAVGIEAGYDLFSRFDKLSASQKLFLFGRFEYYDSYVPASGQQDYEYTDKKRMAVGLNFHPVPQIVVKAEYSHRFLKSQYNNEPSINVGIAYQGFFL